MSPETRHALEKFANEKCEIDAAYASDLKRPFPERIDLYCRIGKFIISYADENQLKVRQAVKEISVFLKENFRVKGFSVTNLRKMVLFSVAYDSNEYLQDLSRKIPWTQNCLIVSLCKTDNEREKYLIICINHAYSKRVLESIIRNGIACSEILCANESGWQGKKNAGKISLKDCSISSDLSGNVSIEVSDEKHDLIMIWDCIKEKLSNLQDSGMPVKNLKFSLKIGNSA